MEPVITLNDLNKTRKQENNTIVIEDPNLKPIRQVDGRMVIDPTTLPNKSQPTVTIPKGARTGAEAMALNEFDKIFGERIQAAREDIENRVAESQIYEEMAENGTLDGDIKNVNIAYDDGSSNNDDYNEYPNKQENTNIEPLFDKVEEPNRNVAYYNKNYGIDIDDSDNPDDPGPRGIIQANVNTYNQNDTAYASNLGTQVPTNWEYNPINKGDNMKIINEPATENTNNKQVIMEENKSNTMVVPKLENREPVNLGIDEKNINFENITFDDEDFEDDQDKSSEDAGFSSLQHDISNTIIPIAKRVDLSAFAVSKKPVSIGNIIKNQKPGRVVAWPLINTGRTISIRSFDGMELQTMHDALENSRNGNVNNAKPCYQLLYEHCVDSDKPVTMESWLNSICFTDDDALFAAAYVSCFKDVNYIPRDCDKDHHMFLTKNINILDMMEFQDKKTEKMFYDISSGTYSSNKNWYDVVRVQISDNIVADIKVPSIYDKTFKYANLDRQFISKYSNMINLDMYIDELYIINFETNKLDRIDYKKFPTDKTKELKQRIVTYAKLIKSSLNSDQLAILISYIREINIRETKIRYFIPETTCPKCGAIIPKEEVRMSATLFIRHQLGQLGTTSIN